MSEVPFASHVRMVPAGPKHFGQRNHTVVQVSLVARFPPLLRGDHFAHIAEPCNMIVSP